MQVVWHGGRFSTPDEVKVAIDDPGYLLGDGVFATMRAYAGACFRAGAHLEGVALGATLLDLELPLALERVAELADEAARRTSAGDACVRVTLSRGGRLSILARAYDVPPPEAYERGVRAVIVSTRRRPPLDPVVKTTSYALEVAARREAERAGAAEGLQLALDGSLACGAMSNVFVVVGDRLFTPALESGCRDGVTRRAILELAPRAGLEPSALRLAPPVLAEADEVFFASTRVECLPVASLDGCALPRSFPRASALRALLRQEATR